VTAAPTTAAPLRVGVIGVGVMGTDHAERLVQRVAGATLVAVADPDVGRAEAVAAQLGSVHAYVDPLDLVADDAVDAVVVASPGAFHEEQVVACIEAGTYALCEKPLTLDAAAALRVVRAERAAGRRLVQVGFMRRFDPEYAALARLLDSGELGRPLLVHHVHRNKTSPTGSRPRWSCATRSPTRSTCAAGCSARRSPRSPVYAPTAVDRAADGLVDPQVAVLRMAGGGIATCEVFVRSGIGYEVRCEVSAERGNATVGLGGGVLVRAANRWGGTVPDDFRERFAAAYDAEVRAWVDACRRGEVVGPTTWDGYAAAAVCEAGVASLLSGSPVPVRLERG
jgi:myo-inositol 2-dehydrogenase/D-chiro-inositol 1-dehydrogenase